MNYVVTVVLVFETDRADEQKFDLWDIKTPVEADGPGKALKAAICLFKGRRQWKGNGLSTRTRSTRGEVG